jgi:hypothetical protein
MKIAHSMRFDGMSGSYMFDGGAAAMSAAKGAHAIGNQFADCQRARGAVRRQHAKVQ